jgi:excisionase family DNA binding protein
MSRIVTAKELGKILKLTETTIYSLATKGKIPGFRVGRSWRFYLDEVLEAIGMSDIPENFYSSASPFTSCPA